MIALEKEVSEEVELASDLHDLLSKLNAYSDKVSAIDTYDTNQLEDIFELTETLRQLKPTISNVEKRLETVSSDMIKHVPTSENLSAYLDELQNLINTKNAELNDHIKIQELSPELDCMKEAIENQANKLENQSTYSIDELNVILLDLETKKHQLEDIIEKIPEGDEALALREQSSLQLGFLNDLLKCLAAKVGNKLAALTRFNAAKDEIDAQLCSIDDNIEDMHSDSVPLIDENLNHIQVIFCKLLKSYFFFSFLSYFFYISCSIFRIINSSFFF